MTENKFEVTDAIVSAAVWAHQNAPTRIGHPFIPMRAAIEAALNASGLPEENARLRAYFAETGRILRNAVVKEDGPSIFIIGGKEHQGKFMDKVYPFLMDMQEQCQQALNKEPTL